MTPETVSIATWNVNSVRSRLGQLVEWLKSPAAADIVCLQELKTVNENFPFMEIEELGYNIAIHGQKTYNGVGILSKYPLSDIVKTIPGNEADEQARYIEAVASVGKSAIRVASVYVPNGQEVGSDKFAYKMAFYDFLYHHFSKLLELDEMLVIGGDYNVAPYPIDVHDPASMEGTVCYHPAERAKLRSLLHLGLYDTFRLCAPDRPQYSWWDYRANSWKAGKGMRIDHLLVSPQAVDHVVGCAVLESMRDAEKASDHAPVMCTLKLAANQQLFAA